MVKLPLLHGLIRRLLVGHVVVGTRCLRRVWRVNKGFQPHSHTLPPPCTHCACCSPLARAVASAHGRLPCVREAMRVVSSLNRQMRH